MKPNRISLMWDEDERRKGEILLPSQQHAARSFSLLCIIQFVLKCNLKLFSRCQVAIIAKTNDFRFLTRAVVDDGDA